jgi:ubiquitin-conjugating enzyme E2 J2
MFAYGEFFSSLIFFSQWNPLWSVSSILTALQSFMIDNVPTVGSVETSDETKQKLASESMDVNCKNRNFVHLFPHLIERFQLLRKQ